MTQLEKAKGASELQTHCKPFRRLVWFVSLIFEDLHGWPITSEMTPTLEATETSVNTAAWPRVKSSASLFASENSLNSFLPSLFPSFLPCVHPSFHPSLSFCLSFCLAFCLSFHPSFHLCIFLNSKIHLKNQMAEAHFKTKSIFLILCLCEKQSKQSNPQGLSGDPSTRH